MKGHFSTGQSLQWAVVPMEEEEELLTDLQIIYKSLKLTHSQHRIRCDVAKFKGEDIFIRRLFWRLEADSMHQLEKLGKTVTRISICGNRSERRNL